MEAKLQIAQDLHLPPQAVTQTFALLSVRGAGKSNAARVMAEQMFEARLPFVTVDPVGCWWGLRSSRDGRGPGLSIPVFGGRHGDVPLERGAGELIADLIVERRLSSILDLSLFESEADKKQFLLTFARRLYLKNEQPLHLFLEEADDFIPQKPMRDEAQLLRAWENIVRRGRNRGLGITLITQRSAAINKMVLTQTETLFVLRTTSPQDRAAIEAWVKYHGQKEEILESLATLRDGEAWVWSPHFLGTVRKFRFNLSSTFDSGATPKHLSSDQVPAPATMADIDLDALRQKLSAAIEHAKAEDPRELRKRIRELERQLQAKAPAAIDARTIENARTEAARAAEKAWVAERANLHRALKAAQTAISRARDVLDAADQPAGGPEATSIRPHEPASKSASPMPREPRCGNHRLPSGEKRVLTAIAQYDQGVTRDQLCVLTGYKRSSRDTYIQRLRESGYVEIAGDSIIATLYGVSALGRGFKPLPTGRDLYDYWLTRLGEGERRVLQSVVEAYPQSIPKERIDDLTGYKRSSRDTYLHRLASRRLVVLSRGEVRATEDLF